MVLRRLGGAASTNPHNKNKVRYTLIPIVIAAFALLALFTIHRPSENLQYVGSLNGYQGFIPRDVVTYNGHTNPKGDLILDNGKVLHNAIWDGKYSDTIIQNHNQIVKLNNEFVGKINPVNNQPYVPLQDVYVIKGQVPIKQVRINGQRYYVIDANKINEADVAGFYTYKGWINNFVAAINTPGTMAAVLPVDSPVFKWTNITGTVAEQTLLYQQYGDGFFGRVVLVLPNKTIIPYVLVLPNKTIIPYGVTSSPSGTAISFSFPQQLYNPSS